MLRKAAIVLSVAMLAGCEMNKGNDNSANRGSAPGDLGRNLPQDNNATIAGSDRSQTASNRQDVTPANGDPKMDATRQRPEDRTLGWNVPEDNNATQHQGQDTSAKHQERQYQASESGSAKTASAQINPDDRAKVRAEAQMAVVDDKDFVSKAGSAGMFEVKSSELATQKTTNPTISKFADQMIQDHTQANRDLTALAGRKGWSIPSQMSAADQQVFDKLNSLSGNDFDRQYLQAQLKAHQEAVQLFEMASSSVKDTDLKAFAQQHLPTLKGHLKMVQENSASVGQ